MARLRHGPGRRRGRRRGAAGTRWRRGPSCRQLPATTRALAGNVVAATKALAPRDDMSGFPALRALLPTGRLCGDDRRGDHRHRHGAHPGPGPRRLDGRGRLRRGRGAARCRARTGPDARRLYSRHHTGLRRQPRRQDSRRPGPFGHDDGRDGPVPLRCLPLARRRAPGLRLRPGPRGARPPGPWARSSTDSPGTRRRSRSSTAPNGPVSPTTWNASPTRAPTPATGQGRHRRGGRTPRPGKSAATWTTSPAAPAAHPDERRPRRTHRPRRLRPVRTTAHPGRRRPG